MSATSDDNKNEPPWGNDFALIPKQEDRSIYDRLRYLESLSYEEKLTIWRRKQAAEKRLETISRMRRETRARVMLVGTGSLKNKALNFLRSRNGAWTTIAEIEATCGVSSMVRIACIDLVREGLAEENCPGRGYSASVKRFVRAIIPGQDPPPTPSRPTTRLNRVLAHLLPEEWIATSTLASLAEISSNAVSSAIHRLRCDRGLAIDRRVEYENGKRKTYYRLHNSNPAQGEKENHENDHHNHQPQTSSRDASDLEGSGRAESGHQSETEPPHTAIPGGEVDPER